LETPLQTPVPKAVIGCARVKHMVAPPPPQWIQIKNHGYIKQNTVHVRTRYNRKRVGSLYQIPTVHAIYCVSASCCINVPCTYVSFTYIVKQFHLQLFFYLDKKMLKVKH
jgi:hypothetical protein